MGAHCGDGSACYCYADNGKYTVGVKFEEGSPDPDMFPLLWLPSHAQY